jgi:group I intron endonuclease
MSAGIYKITNTVNQKVYIGSAVDLERREREHFSGSHTNKVLKQAMKKYGSKNFKWEILCLCDTEFTIENEQLQIDLHKEALGWENMYNICPTAGSTLGVKHSEETKKLMSEAKKGKYVGNKNPNFGKQHTEAAKQKMSEARKGDKNPMYGRTGDKNPRYDQTVYCFKHKDGRVFQGTAYQLQTREGLDQSNLSKVIHSKLNHTKGWLLSYGPILPPESA